jgi:transposase-like protein
LCPKTKIPTFYGYKIVQNNPQVSDTDTIQLKCGHCQARCVKAGKERSGKQRYICTVCKKRQVATFDYNAYKADLNQNIVALTYDDFGRIKKEERTATLFS